MNDAEFRQAYGQHKDMLYRFARRMTGSGPIAEDLVHDCFLILWRNTVSFDRARGTLRSFLIGVTRNLAFRRLSKERAFDELEDEAAICEPIDPAGRERAEIVEQAVSRLPPLQREAIILAEYEEMTLEEIARATGVQVAAVKSRLHRARENLRHSLEPLLEMKGQTYGTHGRRNQ